MESDHEGATSTSAIAMLGGPSLWHAVLDVSLSMALG